MVLRLPHLIPDLLSFFVPVVCLHCGRDPGGSAPLCDGCESSFRPSGPGDRAWERAREALTRTGVVAGLLPSFQFERAGPLRDALHALKYDGAASLGVRLGRRLALRLYSCQVQPADPAAVLVVPVPLHPARRRERGYNQAVFLAEGVGELTGWCVEPGALRRLRNTLSQTKLDAPERSRNVSGAFAPGPKTGMLAGRTIMLVDDVLTTGSTVVECAVTLRRAGALAVLAAPLAIADPDAERAGRD